MMQKARHLQIVLAAAFLAGCNGTSSTVGSWEGSVVTEAINVNLNVTITAPGQGDAGNWSFTGADDQVLNQGDIQTWPPAGDDVVIILIEGSVNDPGASGTLYGTLSADGNSMSGEYALLGAGSHGGFELTRQ